MRKRGMAQKRDADTRSRTLKLWSVAFSHFGSTLFIVSFLVEFVSLSLSWTYSDHFHSVDEWKDQVSTKTPNLRTIRFPDLNERIFVSSFFRALKNHFEPPASNNELCPTKPKTGETNVRRSFFKNSRFTPHLSRPPKKSASKREKMQGLNFKTSLSSLLLLHTGIRVWVGVSSYEEEAYHISEWLTHISNYHSLLLTLWAMGVLKGRERKKAFSWPHDPKNILHSGLPRQECCKIEPLARPRLWNQFQSSLYYFLAMRGLFENRLCSKTKALLIMKRWDVFVDGFYGVVILKDRGDIFTILVFFLAIQKSKDGINFRPGSSDEIGKVDRPDYSVIQFLAWTPSHS